MNRLFDIIVPVYGAVDSLRACLQALADHTGPGHRIHIYDDATPGGEVGQLADDWRRRDPRFHYHRNERRLGYLLNVNRAIAETDRDIVLLNSDAVVTQGWLESMSTCLDADARVGVVSPLSNNATLLTVTDDPECSPELLASTAGQAAVDIPVAVGFCMMIRRRLLEAIDDFDPAFSPGYGEENDFCLRARRHGFRVVACTGAFVAHGGKASFGQEPEIDRRRHEHEHLLAQRWPHYESQVRAWWRDNPLRPQIERLARVNSPRPLVAHLLHRYHSLGGTEGFTRQLVDQLSDEFEHLIIVPDEQPAGWADARCHTPRPGVRVLAFNPAYIQKGPVLLNSPAGLGDAWLDRWLKTVLAASGAGLVHIHHLFGWGTLAPPSLAHSLGLPVVASLHDFHLMCPDYNQIGTDGRPCGKPLVTPEPDCLRCLETKGGLRNKVLADYLLQRRTLIRQAVQEISAFTAPSRYLKARFARAFGNRAASRCQVIPHGVARPSGTEASTHGDCLMVVYVGGLKQLKGARVLVDAARRLESESTIEIHLYGAIGDAGDTLARLPRNCRWRGPFAQGNAASAMRSADIVVIPSLFEETFSLVLSEAWACAKPVLASRLGALEERIEDGRNGWLFPAGDHAALARKLSWLSQPQGREALTRVAADLGRREMPDAASASAPYRKLYRKLLAESPDKPRPADDAGSMPDWTRETHAHNDSMPPVWCPPGDGRRTDPRIAVWARGTPDPARRKVLAELAETSGIGPVIFDHETARQLPWQMAETAGADWLWILEPGETPRPRALPAMRRALSQLGEAPAACMDHVHADRRGDEYGRVYKSIWDPWMAATTPDFDCGWVMRPNFAQQVFGREGAGTPAVERLLETAAFKSAVATPGVPVSVRRDLALGDSLSQIAAGTRSLVADAAPDCARFPDIWVIDHGDAAGLFSTLESLADSGEEAASRCIAIFSDTSLRHARDWPKYWQWCPRDAVAPAANSDSVLLLQAGVELEQAEIVTAWQKFIGRNGVKALGFPVRGALGGIRPAGRIRGHAARAVLPARQWPGGADCGQVLRRHSALTFEATLIDARELRGRRPAATMADSNAASAHFGRDGGVLLAASAPAFSSRHHPYFDLPDAVSRDQRRDPCHAPQLSLRHSDIREDSASRRLSPLSGGGPQLVAIAADEWASSAYRLRLPLEALLKAGSIRPPVPHVAADSGLPSVPEIRRAAPDAVMVQHNSLAATPALLARLKGTTRLIYLLDDLVTELPPRHPSARRAGGLTARHLADSLAGIDLLVVSTPALAERFDAAPCTVRVVENALPDEVWLGLAAQPAAPRNGKRLRFGWAGAQQHETDLRMLKPVVRATRKQVDWVFFGMCPDYLRPFASTVVPPVAFRDYPRALAEADIDVAVAPLADHPFNRCKSALKLLEFGALGIPVIASDLPPYRDAPVRRVDNSPGAWTDAIQSYADDPAAVAADGQTLRRWVLDNHLLSHRINEWMNVIDP